MATRPPLIQDLESIKPLTSQSGPEYWTSLDDKRRLPSFSIRFTARELSMLKFIAATTSDSMHEFCIKAVRKALADKFNTPESIVEAVAEEHQVQCPNCNHDLLLSHRT